MIDYKIYYFDLDKVWVFSLRYKNKEYELYDIDLNRLIDKIETEIGYEYS